jgi:hypothetical protein
MTVVPALLDIYPTEGSFVHIATLSGLSIFTGASSSTSAFAAFTLDEPVSDQGGGPRPEYQIPVIGAL